MGLVEAKDVYSRYFTTSEHVFVGPCWLYAVALNSGSGGKGIIGIYNGSDDSGDRKLELTALTDEHKHFKLCFPIYMGYGCYVEAVQNVRSGFVQLLPA